MERNKPVHFRWWVTSCTWYSPVEWLDSSNHVSCHMHTEEQRDIHNFTLSEAENISVLGIWVALERILFVLPKIGSTLVFSLMRPLRANFGKIRQRTKTIWAGQAKKTKMHCDTLRESARKPRESIETLNMDSRSGHSDGFQAPFFPINLSPDLGYEAPRRGPFAKLTNTITIIVH